MSRKTWVIFVKECIDNLRDRRAWMTSLIMVVLGPGMLLVTLKQTASMSLNEASRPLELPVMGAQNAPGLMDYLERRNVVVQPAPIDSAQAIRDHKVKLVLDISAEYPEAFREGRPAGVRIVYDESQISNQTSVRRLRDLLNQYSMSVGQLRLFARGISPSVIQAIAVEHDNIATPESRAVMVLAIIPMFLLISVFTGGLYVAIDTMAGERERFSLEPLLLNPITTLELVLGKLGATALYAFVTSILTALAFATVVNTVSVDIPGVRIGLSAGGIATILALLLPLCLAIGALQMLVASRSRSFKEAQAAAQVMALLPTLPGMVMIFAPFKAPEWAYSTPVLAQQLLFERILKGETLHMSDVGLACVSTLALGIVLLSVTVKRYNSQKVLFG